MGTEWIPNRYENMNGSGTEWILNGNGVEYIPSPFCGAQIRVEDFVPSATPLCFNHQSLCTSSLVCTVHTCPWIKHWHVAMHTDRVWSAVSIPELVR